MPGHRGHTGTNGLSLKKPLLFLTTGYLAVLHCLNISGSIGFSPQEMHLKIHNNQVASQGGHWLGRIFKHSMWENVQEERRVFSAEEGGDGKWGSEMKGYLMEVNTSALPALNGRTGTADGSYSEADFSSTRTNFLKIKDVGCSS